MNNDNNRPEPLVHMTNRILAVVDDAESAREVLDAMVAIGLADEQLAALSGDAGATWIDADGLHGGRLARLVRGLQRWSTEGDHLRHYAAELAKGRYVIDIHVPPFIAGDRALGVLRRHRAHFINAYHQWTIESLAA